jgi:putative transposase
MQYSPMPDYRRARIKGGTYFFTVKSFERRPILIDKRCRTALRHAIMEVRKTHPFEDLAWVLLPDHLHAIWQLPEGDDNFSARWSLIKKSVTQQCKVWLPPSDSASRRTRHERALWQRRFWEHVIRDDLDLERHVDYIHFNPVKHGYVSRVADWPYSTFHGYVRRDIYPQEWANADHDEQGQFGE